MVSVIFPPKDTDATLLTGTSMSRGPQHASPQKKRYRILSGRMLKTARKKAGVTQNELRRHLGYSSVASISNMERGKQDIKSFDVVKASKLLEVSPLFIMGYKEI